MLQNLIDGLEQPYGPHQHRSGYNHQDMNVEELLRIAVGHFHAGDTGSARRLCLEVLTKWPNHPGVLELLGRASLRLGEASDTIEYTRRAIQVVGPSIECYYLLAEASSALGRPDDAVEAYLAAARLRADPPEILQQAAGELKRAGRYAEAIASYRLLEEMYPDRPEIPFVLGNAWREWGRLDRGVKAYHRALRLAPGYVKALTNVGHALWQLGRLEEAAAAFRAARDRAPDDYPVQMNLGTFAAASGWWPEAEAAFREAARLRPSPEPWTQLGTALGRQDRFAESLDACRQALALDLVYPPALSQTCWILTKLGRLTEAEECIRQSLQAAPNSAETFLTLGNLRLAGQAFPEAVRAYQRVLEIDPARTDALVNLGTVLGELGRDAEAADCFRRAVAAAPGSVEAHHNLGNSLMAEGRAPDALTHFRTAHALAPDNPRVHSNLLYCLHFCPGIGADEIGREHRSWDARHAAPLLPFQPPPVDRTPGRRRRIGYVSPDLREHPIARFLLPTLEHRDRAAVEVFAYASVPTPDVVTARCRAAVDVWRDVAGWPDDRVADLIRADRIDVLVDLSMHMADHRLLVFARKPAPVQATLLAYCGTTGLRAIDFRVTDPYLDPRGVTRPATRSDPPTCPPRTGATSHSPPRRSPRCHLQSPGTSRSDA